MPRSTRHKLEHVKTVFRNGKAYLYFNTGMKNERGNVIYTRLPDPKDHKFAASYAAAKGALTRRKNKTKERRIIDLVEAYQRSPKFTNRAESTRKLYSIYLRKFVEMAGNAPVTGIERRDIRAFLDKMGSTSVQQAALKVVRVLFVFAARNDWRDSDPTLHIEIDHESTPHKAWPDALLQEALQDPAIALPVALLYYTGQRIGDVVAMRWSDIRGDEISVVQDKTSLALTIALHRDLAALLAKEERGLTTILRKDNWEAFSEDGIRQRLQKWAKARGHKVVPHGLRKNAVNTLLEVGCTVAEVSSITGQSLQMVEHYARERDNRLLAKRAMTRWENNSI